MSRSVTKSVFRCVHRATNVPAALMGSAIWTLDDLPSEIATEYFAAIETAGGTISNTNRTAVDTLLNDLQAAGIYRRVVALYLYHGNTYAAAGLNVINPVTDPWGWPITWVGSPTLNASGGFTPASGKYGSAFNPDGLGLTSLTGGGLGFYSSSNASAGEYSMGEYNAFYLAPKEGSGSYCRMSGTFNTVTASTIDLSGFHFACRERNSSTIRAYRNGTQYGSTITKAFSDCYTPVYSLARVGGMFEQPSTSYASTTPIRLSIVTEGLTASEVASLNAAIQAYIGALV